MRIAASIPNRATDYFERACFVKAQAHARGGDVESFIRSDDKVTAIILERANATAGSTGTAGWGAELAHDAFRSFLTGLVPYGGAARLIAQATPASMPNATDAAMYPVRSTVPTAPAWVSELGAIPVRSNTFANVELGPSKKMSHIIVWSRELSKRSDAERIFANLLREDAAAGIDAALFATTAASASAHAGLLNGVSALTGYGGGDATAMKTDLAALASAVSIDGGTGNVTFVVAPERLASLRILDPVLADSLDIAASEAVPTDRVIAVDAASLIIALDPAPDIITGKDATLHMSDVPLELVSDTGPTTADPIRSLWQTGTTALRVLHDIAFAKKRSTAVAYLDGATW